MLPDDCKLDEAVTLRVFDLNADGDGVILLEEVSVVVWDKLLSAVADLLMTNVILLVGVGVELNAAIFSKKNASSKKRKSICLGFHRCIILKRPLKQRSKRMAIYIIY